MDSVHRPCVPLSSRHLRGPQLLTAGGQDFGGTMWGKSQQVFPTPSSELLLPFKPLLQRTKHLCLFFKDFHVTV